ncbi:hypothetical protein [Listeria booriae]|uniref:hypothetical protein n=1 Tax=Listeria booriae TaxID=1552123 RepID=UPI0016251E46|nr:hypothetical protein [Listeria booriae]MBC2100636.1 hypothetical protein [Listeria booriae]MBC2196809.1 hypothetical protein [Listeria booriae]MBC2392204.1 hypothetical protein [Listeria booriae]
MPIIIDTKKAFEEVVIYEQTYIIDFSDEKLLEYEKEAAKWEKISNDENANRSLADNINLVKEGLIVFFDEKIAEEIYKNSGNSSMVCTNIIMQIFKVFKERMAEFEDKKLQEYLEDEDTEISG